MAKPSRQSPPRPGAPRTAALFLSAILVRAQDPQVALLHRLDPGSRFAYALAVDAHLDFGEAARDTRMRLALHFAAEVGGVDGALATVKNRLVRIEARTDSPLARTDYDSARPDAEPGPWRPLAALLDKEFTVRVDPAGHIYGIEVPDGLRAGAQKVAGADFESLFELYYLPMPSEPVAVGGTWDSEVRLVDAMVATGTSARVTNRLAAVESGRARIERAFILPPPRRAGIEFEVEKSAGHAVLDVASGRMVESSMELVARASRAVGEGQRITGTSRLLITMRAEELPPR